jgi:hypothetical protein
MTSNMNELRVTFQNAKCKTLNAGKNSESDADNMLTGI